MPAWLLMVWLGGVAGLEGTYPAGVAAGDARGESAILWTMVSPPQAVTVQVATDGDFDPASIELEQGVVPDAQGVVKVEVAGLSPGQQYYYRFMASDLSISPTGRFRTAPPDHEPRPFRFTLSGDSSFDRAPFYVLQAAAEEDADFHVWFGDTMYGDIPAGGLGVARTLQEYRAKYLQGRSDPYLQAWLASAVTWVGWDDHEVRDDYDGGDPEPGLSPAQIADAYQAFFEWMPVADQAIPQDSYRTYRSFRYGQLAEFFLIDGRQYRDGDLSDECDGELDPFGYLLPPLFRPACVATLLGTEQTMLGPEQLEWLLDGLAASQAKFKFLINNVPLVAIGVLPYDRWDGYDYERRQILRGIDQAGVRNVIVLTTDLHMNLWTPDVTHCLRLHQPGYLLSSDLVIPEAIVGPIAALTAQEGIRDFVMDHFGDLLQGDIGQALLDGVQGPAEQRIRSLIGSPFLEANQFSYLVVEVDADEVRLIWKGISPTAAVPTPATILYEAEVPHRSAARFALPCAVFPVLLGGATLALVTLIGRHRLSRPQSTACTRRSCPRRQE